MSCYYAILANAQEGLTKAGKPRMTSADRAEAKKKRNQDGKDGMWRTTKTGTRIFISAKDGNVYVGGPNGKVIDNTGRNSNFGSALEKKVETKATDLGFTVKRTRDQRKPYNVLTIYDKDGKTVFSDWAFINRNTYQHYTNANDFLSLEKHYRETPPAFKTAKGKPADAVNNILKFSVESADEETIPRMFDMIHHSQKAELAARLRHYRPKLEGFINAQLKRKEKSPVPKPTSYKANLEAGFKLPEMKTKKPTTNAECSYKIEDPIVCNIISKLIAEGVLTDNNCGIAKGGFQRGNKCAKGGTGGPGGAVSTGRRGMSKDGLADAKRDRVKGSQQVRSGSKKPRQDPLKSVPSKDNVKRLDPNRVNTKRDYVKPGLASDKVTVNPIDVFAPDPFEIDPATGVTKTARVGVPGDLVPVPPKLGRLPNLTVHERKAEEEFASAFEKNPDKLTNDFLSIVYKSTPPGQPPTFGTDDAKVLSNSWDNPRLTLEQRSQNRASLNVALHQTANAVTKRAFLKHLDTLEPGDEVLITVGGCGAGKGYALKKVDEASEMKARSKAVWDSAGDQNATENPWIQKELEKRGLIGNYLYVHADAYKHWSDPGMGVIKRAQDPKDGRMVDARVFAESYALGARNHKEFHKRNKDNPNARFVFLKTGAKPKLIDGIPDEARIDADHLHEYALKHVEDNQDKIPPHIIRGATIGERIWGEEQD